MTAGGPAAHDNHATTVVAERHASAVAAALVACGAFTADLRAPRERWIRWKSGVLAPCGCDCRRLTADSTARRLVADALTDTVRDLCPEVDHILGVATAGIVWATAVADRLNLPLTYARTQARRANGRLTEGQPGPARHAVVIDDVVASGASARHAIDAAHRETPLRVAAVVSIANWDFPDLRHQLADWPVRATCGYRHLLDRAHAAGRLTAEDRTRLLDFYRSPHRYPLPPHPR